jgi:hypothetical protein
VNKRRDLVQKAASFAGLDLPTESVVSMLEDAQKVSPEAYDRVVKHFEMVAERSKVAKSFGGSLFNEIGTTRSSGAGGSAGGAWSRIEKAAEGFVQKDANFKGTKAEGIAKFLETSEGMALYAEHQAARKDGI